MGFRAVCLVAALIIYMGPAWGQAPGPPGEVINSARVARTITPTDNTPLALGPTRFVYVSQATACALAVILADDTAAVTLSVPAASANAFLPIRAKVVMATGTTCTPVVGLW
jgi:hypothetical protein